MHTNDVRRSGTVESYCYTLMTHVVLLLTYSNIISYGNRNEYLLPIYKIYVIEYKQHKPEALKRLNCTPD